MLSVRHLVKHYGPVKAVDDVSFELRSGEIVGFLGPNGAGKSTVLKTVTGLLAPTAGTVEVFGHDITLEPVEAKRHIGYLSENNPLYPDYTPREYLRFVAEARGLKGAAARQAADAALERVFVTDMADRRIQALSRGYRQRVGLAAALVGDPEILLLDEPTVGLDPGQIVEIRNLIRSVGRSKTVLLSTHILQEVTQLCDRVIIIHKGRLVAEDTHDDLLRKTPDGRQRVGLTVRRPAEGLADTLRGLPQVEEVSVASADAEHLRLVVTSRPGLAEDLRPAVASAAVASGAALCELGHLRSSLEEIFVRLTSDQESAS